MGNDEQEIAGTSNTAAQIAATEAAYGGPVYVPSGPKGSAALLADMMRKAYPEVPVDPRLRSGSMAEYRAAEVRSAMKAYGLQDHVDQAQLARWINLSAQDLHPADVAAQAKISNPGWFEPRSNSVSALMNNRR